VVVTFQCQRFGLECVVAVPDWREAHDTSIPDRGLAVAVMMADRCRDGGGDVFASIESEEADSSPALRRVGVGLSGMADTLDSNTVETEDDSIHVRFRDPDRDDEIRTPEWAAQPARSVSDGSEVHTGKLEGDQ